MNIPYDEAIKLIEQHDFCEFADYGNDRTSRDWIKKAEEKLGFELPNSYKWWLEHYGGGDLCNEEIFSIYEEEFETATGNDIVFQHLNRNKHNLYPKEYLQILQGSDEDFFFLTTELNDGEYPVYRFDYLSNEYEFYAPSFVHFLIKRIEEKA